MEKFSIFVSVWPTEPPLSQAFPTTKDSGKAKGLGLSVVFGIVRSYGGNIFLRSELGHGTTSVYLPRIEHKVVS